MTRKVLKRKRLSRNSTTTNRHSTKRTTTFCVFPLDRIFISVDTAIPDSRDVEAPDGPSRGCIEVRRSPRSGPVSKRKNRARNTCPAPVYEAEHLLLG